MTAPVLVLLVLYSVLALAVSYVLREMHTLRLWQCDVLRRLNLLEGQTSDKSFNERIDRLRGELPSDIAREFSRRT